jgi:hypothetical protein
MSAYPIPDWSRELLRRDLARQCRRKGVDPRLTRDSARIAYGVADDVLTGWSWFIAQHWLAGTDFDLEMIEANRAAFALLARYHHVCKLAYLGPESTAAAS